MEDVREFIGLLEEGMTEKEKVVLGEGSEHPFHCKCTMCREWWMMMGPEEDGSYGPFNREEIHDD